MEAPTTLTHALTAWDRKRQRGVTLTLVQDRSPLFTTSTMDPHHMTRKHSFLDELIPPERERKRALEMLTSAGKRGLRKPLYRRT